MNWRLRITACAIAVCVVLTLMVGCIGLRHAIIYDHSGEWWLVLIFLIPGIAAVVGLYAPDGNGA